MELIVMSATKIKIILSKEDVEAYALPIDAPERDAVDRSIRRLFRDVREQTGFDALGRNTVVKLFPDATGGCELFVTREDGCGVHKEERVQKKKVLYGFRMPEDALTCCYALSQRGYTGMSELWESEGGIWFLSLEGNPTERPLSLVTIAEEFSNLHTTGCEYLYLMEHGNCLIAEDAVGRLASLQ